MTSRDEWIEAQAGDSEECEAERQLLRDAMAFADAHPAVASMPKLTPATVEDERIEKLSRGKNDETKMA